MIFFKKKVEVNKAGFLLGFSPKGECRFLPKNSVCGKNLNLLRFFETLQHFFNSISLYSPPNKDLKFPLLKLLTLLKIIDTIILIVNNSFNKNKPSSACGFGSSDVYNIIIVNDMSSV